MRLDLDPQRIADEAPGNVGRDVDDDFEILGRGGKSEVSKEDVCAFPDRGTDNGLPETTRTACDKKNLVFEEGFQG